MANGDVYDGEWKDDYEHGLGTLYPANGEPQKGIWENGTFKEGCEGLKEMKLS